jgi:mannose-1-phosphate guanylyltransferase
MKALVLAAGKGTRLGHLTAVSPKPMLPVAGQPLLEHHIDWLRDSGVTEIAVNLHYLPTVITDYFGDGTRHGVKLTYSYEPVLLGTAGAAKKLQEFFDEPFVVVYGDVFTNVDLRRLIGAHQQRSGGASILTMALYHVTNPTECGLVALDEQGRIIRFVEKPPAHEVFSDLANAGLFVCDPQVLGFIPSATEFDFGRDLLPCLLRQRMPVYGLAIEPHEYVIDIGTPAGYARVEQLASLALTDLGAGHSDNARIVLL